jgi:aminoglycoside 3-N-acetyltransferase
MSSKKILENELSECIRDLEINNGDLVYTTGNASRLARSKLKKDDILSALLGSFTSTIGENGTLFAPSASMNLCNTNIVFDIDETPSHEMGAFSEYIRQSKNSIRSFHPFWSICGVGYKADILKNVSRHSYGVGSPWSNFLKHNTKQVNIGVHPSKAVTLIHHLEVITGVPYRYTKEFIHPVRRDKKIVKEPFYMSVMYLESDIKKKIALNEHYFEIMNQKNMLIEAVHKPTGLKMWSFKMNDFYEVALKFFIDDVYNYLEYPPKIKPYTN